MDTIIDRAVAALESLKVTTSDPSLSFADMRRAVRVAEVRAVLEAIREPDQAIFEKWGTDTCFAWDISPTAEIRHADFGTLPAWQIYAKEAEAVWRFAIKQMLANGDTIDLWFET